MRSSKLIFLLAVTGCTTINTSTLDLPSIGQTEIDTVKRSTANEFAATCLSSKSNVKLLREKVEANGWQLANDDDLKDIKLSKLRKKILDIPGGGGHYSETQSIFKKNIGNQILILNLEEHFSRNNPDIDHCEIYSTDELLANCTQIGSILKRPPDRNQKYQSQNAHFIGWSIAHDNKAGDIMCKKNPKQPPCWF